ncbi:sarcosine oxidase subunit alpha [Phenylobacterium sp. Root700]|uniref:sarcosine oxidase subunit alpha n=1 Tax=Phenylobacterium sp. Root700 TaxID=1736591 RepID=UPI0006F3CE4B|nr:sarcosine oxidase subunit alpha [Phenylobacterium sp. Root700]KRB48828.1 sarcosine oxidase subunit alpha [Phenylobacterium sp. Root700]
MTSVYRTKDGGRIQRGKPLRFTFDGRALQGVEGDTLASALLANGIHLVGRSFKYHRPRGILSAGADEPNALVGVRRDAARYTPNLRATQVELYDGLEAESQNRWPSLALDTGALNGLISPFIPAGFYYKTFMWPRKAWDSLYEPFIRAAAGLGRAPTQADPDRYLNRYAHCDVLIAGAGPAGLSAALTAARSGARVILCDEQSEFGGSLLAETSATIEGLPAQVWLQEAIAELAGNPRVVLLPRTTAFGYFAHNLIGLNQRVTDHLAVPSAEQPRERLWQVRAKEVILCAGALERPLVFPGNDRPGILLADSARTYLNRYGVRPGKRVVIITAHDGAYRAALDLHAAGVEIAAIADVRATADGPAPQAARQAGLPIRLRTTITGTRGGLRVEGVSLAAMDGGPSQSVACDAVLMSGGFTPSVHLFSQSRGKLDWDPAAQSFVPGRSAERERSAGASRGLFGLAEVLADGAAAGADAVAAAGLTPPAPRRLEASGIDLGTDGFLGALPGAGAPGAKAFVDWQNDVTAKDLLLATREGFRSIEHIKRYTTTGMATDQGKTSNMNALGVVSEALGTPIPAVGLTTFRMPYTPVTFGSLAATSRGVLFDPVRTTPIHDWAAAQGAVFEDVGLWKRARYFPRGGEDMDAAVARECLAVRSGVGVFDATTLGKIEVVGPDAAKFMNRLYVNAWTKLAPGRSRYGVLLRDDGFIFDDGVVGRVAEDRFHVTTTTGGAPRVLAMMEDYLQTEWPDLNVWLTSTTEQWAVIAVQGPQARQVLEGLVEGIDLSAEALPHMSLTEGKICGVPTRLFRMSFTGELGFEVNVPTSHGRAVWEAIWAAGQPHGMVAYGTETMHVLRAEKGYIIVGQETDGTVTPDDAGLSWAIGRTKADYVGKRSLAREAMNAPDRKQLVGLYTQNPSVVIEEGSQVVADARQQIPMRPIGHVSSSYMSATLGRSIALALVSGGRARMGQTLFVPTADGEVAVTVTSPVFYDQEGVRVNA